MGTDGSPGLPGVPGDPTPPPPPDALLAWCRGRVTAADPARQASAADAAALVIDVWNALLRDPQLRPVVVRTPMDTLLRVRDWLLLTVAGETGHTVEQVARHVTAGITRADLGG